MSDYWDQYQERPLDIPEAERPDFNDLQENAEAGLIKRGISRYLFTRNPERSLKVHRAIGSPMIRKVFIGTVGRSVSRSSGRDNYWLDHSRSKIESATNFSVNGSAFNEVVHTVCAMPASVDVATSIAEGRYGISTAVNAGLAGFSYALVALQRYNRARMVQRVNEELAAGNGFRSSYENWLGIDARAVENYRQTLEVQLQLEASADFPSIESATLLQATPYETY
jgi:hypothetical protein